jgi:hypothetical protein
MRKHFRAREDTKCDGSQDWSLSTVRCEASSTSPCRYGTSAGQNFEKTEGLRVATACRSINGAEALLTIEGVLVGDRSDLFRKDVLPLPLRLQEGTS